MEEVIDRCRGLSIEEEKGFEDIQGGEPEQQETTKWVLVKERLKFIDLEVKLSF